MRSTTGLTLALLALAPLAQAPMADAVSAEPARQVLRRPGHYNYVPTIIQAGGMRRMWWCGGDDAGATDNIFYRETDIRTGRSGPVVSVLKGTVGTWDAAFVCDPSVVQGQWQYPPGSGQTYTLAMYYTGTDDARCLGINNGMGVAYSNDGVTWVKHPEAIFRNPRVDPPASCQPPAYGVGQQSVFSARGQADLWMFVLQVPAPGRGGQNYGLYYSADGLRLQERFLITTKGVPDGFITEADFAYDDRTKSVFMATDRGGTEALIDVYRIPFDALRDGTWTRLATIGPEDTGNPRNQGAGIVRNPFGNATPFLPNLTVVFGSGQIAAIDVNSWQLWERRITVPSP